MSQSILLASNTGAGTSSDLTLAAGVYGRMGLFTGLPLPVNAAFSQTNTGGSLVASTPYYYRVSAITAQGESLASVETTITTSSNAPSTHTVVVNWTAVPGATGYKVYGRTTGAELLIATVGAVTTYTDTGSITPAGALPSVNNSGEGISGNTQIPVYTATPGSNQLIGHLSLFNPVMTLIGPGTFRAIRPAGPTAGVFGDT